MVFCAKRNNAYSVQLRPLLRETCISILCQEGGGPAWLAPRRPWRGGSRVKHGLASPSRSEGPLSNLYNPNSCKVTQTVLQVWE